MKTQEMRATPRNKLLGLIADALKRGRTAGDNVQLPLLGGLGSLLLGGSPEELDALSYGDYPMYVPAESNVPNVKSGRDQSMADTVGAIPLAALPVQVARAAGKRFAESGAAESLQDLVARLGVPETAATPSYVIKPKGGNWLSGSVEDALRGLKNRRIEEADYIRGIRTLAEENPALSGEWAGWLNAKVASDPTYRAVPGPVAFREWASQAGYPVPPREGPEYALNNWIDKQLTRYVKNEMATPEDPVRALAERGVLHVDQDALPYGTRTVHPTGEVFEKLGSSETAKRWETAADYAISPDRARTFLGTRNGATGVPTVERNPWLAKIPPDTNVYDLSARGSEPRDLGFDHLIDELRNAINPDSGLPPELLLKYDSLPRVSVPQAVERVAKINEWRAAQKAEANAALANNAATSLVKEYPEQGFRWVELKAKPGEAPEGWLYNRNRGYWFDPYDETVQPMQIDDGREALEQALKYEGDTMGHCVGGYCEDVFGGATRIFSLRDAKGQPHVTIEMEPSALRYPSSGEAFARLPQQKKNEYAEHVRQWRQRNPEVEELTDEDVAKALEEAGVPPLPGRILQIKGKQNRKPNPEYIPFVQDFVRSQGPWSEVKDLQNTDLIPGDNHNEIARALAQHFADRGTRVDDGYRIADLLRRDLGSKGYTTKEELIKLLGDKGYAQGGFVQYDHAGIGARADQLARELGL